MLLRTYSVLLLLLSACATMAPGSKEMVTRSPRLANLQRAESLPWTDDGRCVVREASNEWSVLAERCFHALDHERIRFQDVMGRCAVASTGAVVGGVGLCILAAPEIAGAVVVIGLVVVAVAIAEELESYERRGRIDPEPEASHEAVRPVAPPKPSVQEPVATGKPKPEGSPLGRDWLPPQSLEPRERRPECTPRRVPPKGGNPLHNRCADMMPGNAFRGANALVNGKAFDALQPATRTLWEIKTTAIETYNPFVQKMELDKQVREALREQALAAACGYDFVIGVLTEAHKELLDREERGFKVVVMEWC